MTKPCSMCHWYAPSRELCERTANARRMRSTATCAYWVSVYQIRSENFRLARARRPGAK